MFEYNERVLEDDYPMYYGYLYVIDDVVTVNEYDEYTVGDYKRRFRVSEVKSCDIIGRNIEFTDDGQFVYEES